MRPVRWTLLPKPVPPPVFRPVSTGVASGVAPGVRWCPLVSAGVRWCPHQVLPVLTLAIIEIYKKLYQKTENRKTYFFDEDIEKYFWSFLTVFR